MSILAPPLASNAPVMVTPALKTAASAAVNPSTVVAPSTSNVPVTVTFELAATVVNEPAAAVDPPITTLSAVPPFMSAVSATNESMLAVPSKYKSFHSNEDVPKSLALSLEGTRSLPNLAVAVIVSPVVSPRFTSPSKVVVLVADKVVKAPEDA